MSDSESLSPIRLSPKSVPVSQPIDHYKAALIETASPERLLVMLYDGMLKFLNLALHSLAQSDFEGTHRHILKTEAILLELMSVLDMEIGGELAEQLFQLYDYMYRLLVQANMQRDPEPIQEVLALLAPLRQTWDEAANQVAQLRLEGKFELRAPGARSVSG